MSDNHLPTEVELAYEVMPCNALRVAQHPGPEPHPCSYFLKWGRYHSYDYLPDGPPPTPGIVQESRYVGRGPLVPEILSGCRKAPVMAVGINPNLPGWWSYSRNAVNPLFDDYKQYAHYFRYRATAKLRIPLPQYQAFGGNAGADAPLIDDDPPRPATWELNVPADHGARRIPVEPQPLTMYQNYESLLKDLALAMGWPPDGIRIGEDLSYGNMVGCPSAKWITKPDPADDAVPPMPPMTLDEQRGIVTECFHTRRYFLRQLFQSLPAVLLVFSQSTADAFIAEMHGRFSSAAKPKPGDRIKDLLGQTVRLRYGTRDDGSPLEARVIFSPHITGNPAEFGPARDRVLAQLVEEAHLGHLRFNPATGHLARPVGSCVFCTMLEIGPCEYVAELTELKTAPRLTAAGGAPTPSLVSEKQEQNRLLSHFTATAPQESRVGWELSGDPERPDAKVSR